MTSSSKTMEKANLSHLAVLLALYLAVYIAPLGFRPAVIPDEARYAEIPREMLASGKWLFPTFNGMKYFEKPSAAYWPAMASMKLFGETRFAARLPQALAAGLSVLLLYFLILKMRRDGKLAFISAAVLLSMSEPLLVGTFAVIDSIFSLFVSSAMASFLIAWSESGPLKRQIFLFLAGLSCALAFMTKGFLGLVIPGASIAAFLIWMRDWRAFLLMPWAPLAGFLFMAGPWVLAVQAQTPDFWRYFIAVEHLGRFAGKGTESHPEPFWYYVPVLVAGMLPFSAFLRSLWDGRKSLDFNKPSTRFFITWVAMPFALLSISSGKLGTYVLPLFPPLAAFMAVSVMGALESGARRSFDIAANLIACLLAIASASMLILQILAPELALYGSGETCKWVFVVVAAAVSSLLFHLSAKASLPSSKMLSLCAAALVPMLCWSLAFPDFAAERKAPEKVLESWRPIIGETPLAASSDIAGIACWTYRRDDITLFRDAGEFRYGVNKAAPKKRLLDLDEFRSAAADAQWDGSRICVMLPRRWADRLLDDINSSRRFDSEEYSLILYGPTEGSR